MDALALLHQDHVNVATLFDQYVLSDDREAKNGLADQILRELQLHAELEEQHVYPVLQAESAMAEVAIAFEEHHLAELVMCQLTDLEPGSEAFSVKLAQLKHLVQRHIEMEERVLFPLAEQVLGTDALRTLGTQLEATKQSLAKQLPRLSVTMIAEAPETQRTDPA